MRKTISDFLHRIGLHRLARWVANTGGSGGGPQEPL
jgi:hypothetical protein